MVSINLTDKFSSSEYNIGAMICHTPKSLPPSASINGELTDNQCVLVNSLDQLLDYFGDPFISPSSYPELLLCYRLVQNGIPMYVVTVDDMLHYNDGFEISYNGFTEIQFYDTTEESRLPKLTFKLKSNIKFCQPYLYSTYNNGTLKVNVDRYMLDRQVMQNSTNDNKLDFNMKYDTISYTFNVYTDTDKSIINAFSNYGIEIQVDNHNTPNTLISVLSNYPLFRPKMLNDYTDYKYSVNLHTNNYTYYLPVDKAELEYCRAIDKLNSVSNKPYFLSLCQLYRSIPLNDPNNSSVVLYNYLKPLRAIECTSILNYLLSSFPQESDTYLFINTPDLPFSSVLDWLTQRGMYEATDQLSDNYNCDLFFGYVTEQVHSNLNNSLAHPVYYSLASLSMYSMLLSNNSVVSMYTPTGISKIDMVYRQPKSLINETSASDLLNTRCNSLVTFDTNKLWVYGDRSLSSKPNLRYSHISRLVVLIRRIVTEYLEQAKFTINNYMTMQAYINTINTDILDLLKTGGVLQRYNTSFSIEGKSVLVTIELFFNSTIESVQLNFNI